ncbi:FAD binding domain-containing protein [Nonomuraea muscovyensis]|uniref:Carbon-monoxide dehydrogenase medium subunit n=1 Tax=Nonomuraea muscovyensis TaxID=1124761 RepID=A0A7X0C3G4_9ACTN|nr:xanthine dehydrogenase family protein subunit M [Nonomuraea muscovyensis]MBB6347803.1 carbon-monoxide dehydrogenase medium subunit [Nonomuraea muscovyensis]MDF2704665.1 carbon monoxide dehydrogenase, medium chain [Nonomuraea muscovyensis]
MIHNGFTLHSPATLAEALALLGDGAVALAGGQSLIPELKTGRVRPGSVIDIGALAELDGVRDEGDVLAVGALTRHHRLHTAPAVRAKAPLLAHAAGRIADPQVRHMGTIGGSIAHADPAADLPVALLALDARVVLAGPDGRREEPLARFAGPADGELITEVRVPDQRGRPWSYQKFHRDALEWAVVAVAAAGDRVALAGMADRPVLAEAVMAALPDDGAALLADQGCDPPDDHRASAAYRRHLARVLTARALRELRGETCA